MNNDTYLKISQICPDDVKGYLRIDQDEEDMMLIMAIDGARDYIMKYTNLPLETLDTMGSVSMACLILINDFYENRSLNIESNTKVNKILGSILSMNRDLG